jgi:two-component system, NtrC family, sensor kinase
MNDTKHLKHNSEIASWYEQLYTNTSIGILIVDDKRMILDINQTCTELFGYSKPSELIGKSARCLHMSEESYLFFGKKHFSAVMTNESLSLTYQLQRRDGSSFWANFTGQPNLKRKGALWTIVDISAQIAAEESLKNSEYKFRLLADNTFDWEYWIDPDGQYIYTSPACERITGYSPQEFNDNPQLLFNLIREDYRHKLAEHFSTEQKEKISSCSMEIPIITKNGTEKWIEHNCKPIFKENGESAGRCGNNRDITESYRDKEEKGLLFQQISAAKDQWENTMDSIDDLVMIIDIEERITLCNKRVADLLNCTYDSLLGKHWRTILSAGGMAFSTQDNNIYECYYPATEQWFLIKKYDYLNPSNSTTTSSVITLNDLTENRNMTLKLEKTLEELKHSQSKLLQSEKMASIGQLAAGVAHEINNPMGFISQNLKTLKKYVNKLATFISAQKGALSQQPEEQTEQIKELEKKLKINYLLEDTDDLIDESLDGAGRIQTIVNNLKTFSRVDQNDVSIINLNDCVDGTINIIWNELKYNVSIEKNYGDLPLVTCFPQQISQVFMNLMINSSHAITTKGIISIKSWADDRFAYITIADDGHGIPDENLKHIFEPFFTTKEPGKGTGLGLSMVYDIINNHCGEISVESQLDKGTVFKIKLPLDSGLAS